MGRMADPLHLMLIGDCTLATPYLPEHLRNEVVLAARLRACYPHDRILVTNEGLDGESLSDFHRRYDRTLARHRPPDYVFVRYGVNDRRRDGIEHFEVQLRHLIQRLRHDLPDIRIMLETGIFVDYPDHYRFDRNRVLQPVYNIVRATAARSGLPLVDLYARMARETAQGNWDLRVRGYGTVDPHDVVLGAALDQLHGHDPHWFTNIHPNPRGIQVIVDEEVQVLQQHWPLTLRAQSYQAREYGAG